MSLSLGGIVSDAVKAGVAGIAGNDNNPKTEIEAINVKNTNLRDFLAHFASKDEYVNELNTKNTFEVVFKFYPTIQFTPTVADDSNKSALDMLKDAGNNIGNSLVQSGIHAVNNALNNLTGGLLNQFTKTDPDVMQAHDYSSHFEAKKYSFLHYLARANLLTSKTVSFFKTNHRKEIPLELQLGYYVQQIKMPSIKLQDGGKSKPLPSIGEFPVNGIFATPDNNKLTMTILNTKLPLIERIFYPWLKEMSLPYWVYETQPYTTATILVDFNKHTDMQYVFTGCRPSSISLLNASQQNNQNFQRDVEFIFDSLVITSKLTTRPDPYDTLIDTGLGLVSNAGTMLNMIK